MEPNIVTALHSTAHQCRHSIVDAPCVLCVGSLLVPPCTSMGLSKRGVGVEPLFSGFFGTAAFCGPECRIGRL